MLHSVIYKHREREKQRRLFKRVARETNELFY